MRSSGSMFVDGMFVPGGADYAEMFETTDGNPIDAGYFVTTKGKKICKATSKDTYIAGVTSATPGVIGDSGEMRWKDKFVTDEWGRIQHHEVTIPAQTDNEGRIILPERKEIQPILNPNWDPRKDYVSRLQRPEWVAVGLVGKLLIRDDGTCEVNGYCNPSDEGIATKASQGYRVMERTGPNQVMVLLNSVPANQSNRVEELKELAKIKEQSIKHLKELAKLKEQGCLTDEEFQSEKQKLLNS
ncbi:MAG: peptidase G2 autoproteolytic cleavage domain-containing protein [Bacillota bacterium]